jgi:pyridoxine/pyridoxamine 5'-phosphate oxidase
MTEWYETRDGMFTKAWEVLDTAREVTLATQSRAGWPEARTVVMRNVDTPRRTLQINTDRHSHKIDSLRENPRAAILLWHPDLQLQIRLQVEVFIQTGVSVADAWARVPDRSRQSYGTSPTPGTPIDDALDYTKPCLQAAFCVLHCPAVTVDLVHLGPQHRRAAYTRDGDWAGQWLSP